MSDRKSGVTISQWRIDHPRKAADVCHERNRAIAEDDRMSAYEVDEYGNEAGPLMRVDRQLTTVLDTTFQQLSALSQTADRHESGFLELQQNVLNVHSFLVQLNSPGYGEISEFVTGKLAELSNMLIATRDQRLMELNQSILAQMADMGNSAAQNAIEHAATAIALRSDELRGELQLAISSKASEERQLALQRERGVLDVFTRQLSDLQVAITSQSKQEIAAVVHSALTRVNAQFEDMRGVMENFADKSALEAMQAKIGFAIDNRAAHLGMKIQRELTAVELESIKRDQQNTELARTASVDANEALKRQLVQFRAETQTIASRTAAVEKHVCEADEVTGDLRAVVDAIRRDFDEVRSGLGNLKQTTCAEGKLLRSNVERLVDLKVKQLADVERSLMERMESFAVQLRSEVDEVKAHAAEREVSREAARRAPEDAGARASLRLMQRELENQKSLVADLRGAASAGRENGKRVDSVEKQMIALQAQVSRQERLAREASTLQSERFDERISEEMRNMRLVVENSTYANACNVERLEALIRTVWTGKPAADVPRPPPASEPAPQSRPAAAGIPSPDSVKVAMAAALDADSSGRASSKHRRHRDRKHHEKRESSSDASRRHKHRRSERKSRHKQRRHRHGSDEESSVSGGSTSSYGSDGTSDYSSGSSTKSKRRAQRRKAAREQRKVVDKRTSAAESHTSSLRKVLGGDYLCDVEAIWKYMHDFNKADGKESHKQTVNAYTHAVCSYAERQPECKRPALPRIQKAAEQVRTAAQNLSTGSGLRQAVLSATKTYFGKVVEFHLAFDCGFDSGLFAKRTAFPRMCREHGYITTVCPTWLSLADYDDAKAFSIVAELKEVEKAALQRDNPQDGHANAKKPKGKWSGGRPAAAKDEDKKKEKDSPPGNDSGTH